ncbi:MAG: nucleoside triphosphate pyrophosphohydrolase family protein [Bacteroidetes bacterium]|jgi:NTP pyrophosphatase (non-canonical NTP hydrolase)|nr:nucleoside triphosphate pyrophosphohydrolase family protein [Bacteroidota bacterium]
MSDYNFTEYQAAARRTALYPPEEGIIYTTLGLVGEAGEIAEKVKKVIRDRGGNFEDSKDEIAKELGDVLWYVANLAFELDYDLADIAAINIQKLVDRQERGKIHGDGDNR